MGRPGTPQHYSGSAAVAGTVIQLERGLGQSILVRNLDATDSLYLSLTPSGKVYFTIPKLQEFRFDCLFHQFWIAASANTPAWCAVTVEG